VRHALLTVAALLASLVAGAASAANEPAGTAWFEFLHVEANEGGSSGGHAAIRFGDRVFHFQHHPGGLMRLHRESASAFLHTYARLQNRAVHVQRVHVRPETLERLRGRFGARLVDEEGRFARLAALEAEEALLAARDAGTTPLVPVRGAGFFAETRAGAGPAAPQPGASPPFGGDAAPLAEQAAERLAAEVVLRVLADAPPLRPDVVRDEPLDELTLAPDERVALARHAEALDARAASLRTSRRPDFGSALLLTLARRATVARSLEAGRLILLDAYPSDAQALTPGEVRAQAEHLPALLAEARAELTRARRALATAAAVRELDLTTIEAATNRYLELRGAIEDGRPLRIARGPLLPDGEAMLPVPADLAAPGADTHFAATRAAQHAGLYRAELRARLGYDLLQRNCVSEIFREIAVALGDDVPGGSDPLAVETLDCAGSTQALGGCVDPAERLRFIPFVAAGAVAGEYRVATTRTVPSLRASRLAEMYARESDLLVFLREGNVLTSSLYRARDEDSAFLFFTEDAPLARPLLGAVNLAVGLGASAAGVLALPADGGALLLRGVRGALFSLPELAFVTIRKGSFAYAPREPLAGAREAGGVGASAPAQAAGAAPSPARG